MTKTQKLFPVDTEHELAQWVVADGLNGLCPFVEYVNGDSTACLDGDFTAKELSAIAFYMLRGHTDKGQDGNSAGKPKT